MPKRQLTREDIDQIKRKEALRLFAYPDPLSPLAKATKGMKLPWGKAFAPDIMAGLKPEIRALSGKPWTCGFGSTSGVGPETRWTEAQALEALDRDLDDAQNAVERLVKVSLTQTQYAALVSLVFNIGSGNFAKSTLLKRLNEGNYDEAANRFMDFVKARNQLTGQLEFSQGLANRRAVEKAYFLRGMFVASSDVVPEEVVEPNARPATKDPKMLLTAGTAGSVTLATSLSEAAKQIEPLAPYSDTIRLVLMGLVVMGAVLGVVYALRERRESRE